jgi:hypothetical protein
VCNFVQWILHYTEPEHNGNLSLLENLYSPWDPKWITCIKRNLPETEKFSVLCGYVTGRFYCSFISRNLSITETYLYWKTFTAPGIQNEAPALNGTCLKWKNFRSYTVMLQAGFTVVLYKYAEFLGKTFRHYLFCIYLNSPDFFFRKPRLIFTRLYGFTYQKAIIFEEFLDTKLPEFIDFPKKVARYDTVMSQFYTR